MTVLATELDALRRIEPRQVLGRAAVVRGLSVVVDDLPLPVGAMVRIERNGNASDEDGFSIGEVVGFDGPRSIVMLYGAAGGVSPGARVLSEQSARMAPVGRCLLGRVINGLGEPIDGGPRLTETVLRDIDPEPTRALDRCRIDEPLPTGIAAIDAMLTIGKGQRVGIFSGPGVGKSMLLASIARNTAADVNVIALIGERGREVGEFLHSVLGDQGRARSVVVVATGDESPLLRVRAAMVACTVAEHFRELGADVMLMMDSMTRFAQSQRQIGLTVGEQPATKGYTPSVFAMMPRLLERAGSLRGHGSITGLYAVLVEGDDLTEPISDTARGILDGHIALSRKLAARGHYPAIDLLESISRVADTVCDEHHIRARRELLRIIAAHAEAEEILSIGAYAPGSNIDCDIAIAMQERIDGFLRQDPRDSANYPETCRTLIELAHTSQQLRGKLSAERRSASA